MTLAGSLLGAGMSVNGLLGGELVCALTNTIYRITTTSLPCVGVWVGAPTADHTVGEANDGNVLIGHESADGTPVTVTTILSGGQTLTETNLVGFLVLIDDASKLRFWAANADDVVEYQVMGAKNTEGD